MKWEARDDKHKKTLTLHLRERGQYTDKELRGVFKQVPGVNRYKRKDGDYGVIFGVAFLFDFSEVLPKLEEFLGIADVGFVDTTPKHESEYNDGFNDGVNYQKEPFGSRVAKWFDDRKITENGTIVGQLQKLEEEQDELRTGLFKIDNDEIKDAIGDMAVVLAGLAHMNGMTFEECCEHAWDEIKDRTGHLNEDGVFVKDEPAYRVLEKGEIIQEGDEVWSIKQRWEKVADLSVGNPVYLTDFRRPL